MAKVDEANESLVWFFKNIQPISVGACSIFWMDVLRTELITGSQESSAHIEVKFTSILNE